jgi:hypothetical protein
LGEPFLPPGITVPPTWLNWRLNPKLYESFERWSKPDSELTLPARLWGRWLEFQITDAPSDALRSMRLLAQTARVRLARGAWFGAKKLTYAPDHRPQ